MDGDSARAPGCAGRPRTRVGSPLYFRSCGARPTVQNGYSTAPGADAGAPSTTTWLTSGPADHDVGADVHQGRSPRPAPTCAGPRCVGWITPLAGPHWLLTATIAVDRRQCTLLRTGCAGVVHDHGGIGRLGHRDAVDRATAANFHTLPRLRTLRTMDAQLVARHHRAAELGPLDRHEIDHACQPHPAQASPPPARPRSAPCSR